MKKVKVMETPFLDKKRGYMEAEEALLGSIEGERCKGGNMKIIRIDTCFNCPYSDVSHEQYLCTEDFDERDNRKIDDPFTIPSFCPLPDAEVKDANQHNNKR